MHLQGGWLVLDELSSSRRRLCVVANPTKWGSGRELHVLHGRCWHQLLGRALWRRVLSCLPENCQLTTLHMNMWICFPWCNWYTIALNQMQHNPYCFYSALKVCVEWRTEKWRLLMEGNLKSLSPAGLRPVYFNLLQHIDHFPILNLSLLQIILRFWKHHCTTLCWDFSENVRWFFCETKPETKINILMCLVKDNWGLSVVKLIICIFHGCQFILSGWTFHRGLNSEMIKFELNCFFFFSIS